ncbi:hypothetical protein D3C83_107330 [compost metagenome]
MVFGGVDTGSMNAKLAAIVASTAVGTGSRPPACAMPMSTGSIMLVTAVLLVTSVSRSISATAAIMRPAGWRATSPRPPSTP